MKYGLLLLALLGISIASLDQNGDIEFESVIYAEDMNTRFSEINTFLTRQGFTEKTFHTFQPGEVISKDGILNEFYKIDDFYAANSLNDKLGSDNINNPTNEILSSELNILFNDTIVAIMGEPGSSQDDFILVTKNTDNTLAPLVFDNFNLLNEDDYYTNSVVIDYGDPLDDYPSALTSIDNTCTSDLYPMLDCNLKFNYDTDYFLNGVTYTTSITGTSGCAAGTIYNRTSCVDNPGTFNDPDSVFGFATFQ